MEPGTWTGTETEPGMTAPIKYIFWTTGWTSVVGDWNGDGTTKIGLYKDGAWYLDWNGNGVWDAGTDKVYIFGTAGWTSVVGDWNGDGKPRLGSTRMEPGTWTGTETGPGMTVPTRYIFSVTGWTSVVGDWNGDGKPRSGSTRMEPGTWTGTETESGMTVQIRYIFSVLPGGTQLLGTGTETGPKIGLYKDGTWYLDWNGNGAWDNVIDKVYIFGTTGWMSVVGDWNGDGATKIGLYMDGTWYVDRNGDGMYTTGVNTAYTFRGEDGWTPLVRDWNGSGTTKIGVVNGLAPGIWTTTEMVYGMRIPIKSIISWNASQLYSSHW